MWHAARLTARAHLSSRLKPVPLNVRNITVGAGLLANAMVQALPQREFKRVRQQAGSYSHIWPRLASAAKLLADTAH